MTKEGQESYERELGGIGVKLGALHEGQVVLFRKLEEISTTINNLTVNGCAVGGKHTLDIAELKDRPHKTMALLSALSGVVSILAAAIAWIFSHGGK